MCRRMTRAVMVWLAFVAAIPPAVGGQDSSLVDRVRAHLDTLIPLTRSAAEDAARAAAVRDSLLRANPEHTLDTLRFGPILVVTFPDQRRPAEEIVGAAWEEIAPWVDGSPSLSGTTFFFDWRGRKTPPSLEPGVVPIRAPAWVAASTMGWHTGAALGRALSGDLGGPLAAWTGNWTVGPPPRPERVYRELATTPSRANRACLRGDTHACAAALSALADRPPLTEWYTPEEAGALALQLHDRWMQQSWYRRDLQTQAGGLRCGEGASAGRYEACYAYLDEMGNRVPPPLTATARQTLAWVALERGGQGAWDRLTADPSRTPMEALEAASGLTADGLVSEWRDWIMEERPVVYAELPGTVAVAVAWFLIFGLLAMRSTRWRSA